MGCILGRLHSNEGHQVDALEVSIATISYSGRCSQKASSLSKSYSQENSKKHSKTSSQDSPMKGAVNVTMGENGSGIDVEIDSMMDANTQGAFCGKKNVRKNGQKDDDFDAIIKSNKRKEGKQIQSKIDSHLDAKATAQSHRHWHFPKWGHQKRCSFCGHTSHQSILREDLGGSRSHHKHCKNFSTLRMALAHLPLPHLALLPHLDPVPHLESLQRLQMRRESPSFGVCAMAFANLLAVNALDLTAPASDVLLKNRKNAWVQLAGHPGSFAPAGPHTIWKKRMTNENNETLAYQCMMGDAVASIVPKFYREVEYNGDFFIEMEDLLQNFNCPNVMDIKMGTRTFLESEVKNAVLRKDLYEKMVKLNSSEPTAEEHAQKAITKLRYMQFREKQSSTTVLGFRIEAIRMAGEKTNADLKSVKKYTEVDLSRDNFKTLNTRWQVKNLMAQFLAGDETSQSRLIERLKDIRKRFEMSSFFKNHEVIGSSILVMYDSDHRASAWMIDFAKTLPVNKKQTLNHRTPWQPGNHEDGYLFGLDNLISILEDIDFTEEEHNHPVLQITTRD